MSAEHPLLVITEPPRDGDQEPVRVALDVLRAAAQVKVVSATSSEELGQLLEKRGRRRPVLIGGDELLHAVVERLHRRRELAGSLLGWIPMHTRHDLASTLGLPLEPANAARVVIGGTERWLDLLVDDAGGVAVNSVRVGAPAPTRERRTGGSPSLARAAARLGSLIGQPRRAGWRLRVEADGALLTDLNRRVLMVGLANGADIGGGALATEVSPDDGLAEVVLSQPSGRLAWLSQPGTSRGDHVRREGVQVVRARAVTVSGPDFPYDTDGVSCGPVRLRTWTVEHSAWRLTVPAPS